MSTAEGVKITSLEMDSDDGYLVIHYESSSGHADRFRLRYALKVMEEVVAIGERVRLQDKLTAKPSDLKKAKPLCVHERVRKSSDDDIKFLHSLYVRRFLLRQLQDDFETGVLRKDDPWMVKFVTHFAEGREWKLGTKF